MTTNSRHQALRSENSPWTALTFLNHGSYGAIPRSVLRERERWRQTMERQPVDFLARRWWGLVAEARAKVAPFLGTSSGNIAFVANATAGIQAVVRSCTGNPATPSSPQTTGTMPSTESFGSRWIGREVA